MERWLGQLVVSFLAMALPTALPLPPSPAPAIRVVSAAPTLQSRSVLSEIAAAGVAAVDGKTGAVLYRQASSTPHPLASITKLMTALEVLERNPDWDQLVTIRTADLRSGGRVLLSVGDQVSVRGLFYLMVVSSSNEAAVALARSTGLTHQAFVNAMNRRAAALKLSSLRFVDPAGLNAGNVGSAEDIARLANLAFQREAIATAARRSQYTFTIANTGARRQAQTTDRLLETLNGGVLRLVGGKTGYLDEAGYNFVAVFEQTGAFVSVAVLGAQSPDARWQESLRVARWVFSSYRWPALGG